MKILVVDDEAGIRSVIREYLENENYDVIESSNGEEAINIALDNNIDLIIMDIMMPVLDGFSAAKEILKDKKIPIIMLSARSEEYDKLLGFDLGIDDYITKPFSPKEMVARVKAVLKRSYNITDAFVYDGLTVDFRAHTVKVDEKEVKVTPKEYELLCYFISNPHVALSREQLLAKVWGYDFFGADRTVDTHIKMLRNNLGTYRNLITTVRSVGYKFETTK